MLLRRSAFQAQPRRTQGRRGQPWGRPSGGQKGYARPYSPHCEHRAQRTTNIECRARLQQALIVTRASTCLPQSPLSTHAGVSDCHLVELAQLLTTIATKLGLEPEIGWVEELVHIVIDGVDIEHEVQAACDDWKVKNYAGFGYNVAQLVKGFAK